MNPIVAIAVALWALTTLLPTALFYVATVGALVLGTRLLDGVSGRSVLGVAFIAAGIAPYAYAVFLGKRADALNAQPKEITRHVDPPPSRRRLVVDEESGARWRHLINANVFDEIFVRQFGGRQVTRMFLQADAQCLHEAARVMWGSKDEILLAANAYIYCPQIERTTKLPSGALFLTIDHGAPGRGRWHNSDYWTKEGAVFELREGDGPSGRTVARLDNRFERRPVFPPVLTFLWFQYAPVPTRTRAGARSVTDFLMEVFRVDEDAIEPRRLVTEDEKERQLSRLLDGPPPDGLQHSIRLRLALPLIGMLEEQASADAWIKVFMGHEGAERALESFTDGTSLDNARCRALLPVMRMPSPEGRSAQHQQLGPDGSMTRACRNRFGTAPSTASPSG